MAPMSSSTGVSGVNGETARTAASNVSQSGALKKALRGRSWPGGAPSIPVASKVKAGIITVPQVSSNARQTVSAPSSTLPNERSDECTTTWEPLSRSSERSPSTMFVRETGMVMSGTSFG